MLRTILYILAGTILGAVLSYAYLDYNKPHSANPKENKTILKTSAQENVSNYQFLNPMVDCENFDKVYFDDMLGFREEILDYVHDVIARSNYEIAFYFRDLVTGSVVAHDEEVKFTPSSLMKVVILVAVLKELEVSSDLSDKMITYSKKMKISYTNEDEYDFIDGKDYSILELTEIMIQYSDNRATLLIIEEIGLNKIQKVQDDLRFDIKKDTDMYERVIGVKSYATIFRTLYNATYLSKKRSEQALNILSKSNFREGIRRAVPSEIRVAQKFGIRQFEIKGQKELRTEQLHEFGIVYRPGKPYLLGVMIKGDDLHLMNEIIYKLTQRIDQEVSERIKLIEANGIPADAR